ncbi:MAG: hypothetical protein NTU51_01330 [Bacteroidetes bacterium]|nr:hypothetical protein [Bacteroidota bacterium]
MGVKRKITTGGFCILLIAAGIAMFSSCMKKESFSDIPQIAFAGYTNLFDSTKIAKKGILTISFQDGDGDIGLNSWDTYPPYDSTSIYFYNYYIDLYEKKNGVFVKDTTLATSLNARIPNLTPDDPNKAIKGLIVDTLPLNPHPVYDTIQFSMFIYDRALHKSNVVFTPEIVVRRP